LFSPAEREDALPDYERNYWNRVTQRKLSRRGALRAGGFTAAGLSAAALVGCGDDDDDDGGDSTATSTSTSGGGTATTTATATEAAGTPKQGGHFIVHMQTQPRSLDHDFDVFVPIAAHTNNALLKFTPDLSEIITDAAEALPEQPDELTYTFKLHQGVKFQNLDPVNGRELTSEDVKFSMERQMTDEAGKFQHAYFYRGKVQSIETPDKYTVVVKMTRKFAPFVAYAANAWSQITAPEIVTKFGDLTAVAIGTGPFIFKEWQKDVRIDFERNPDYFKEGKPYVDKFSYLVAADPDTAATLFIDKQVHALSTGISQQGRVKDGRGDANYKAQPQQGMTIMRMPPTSKDLPYQEPYSDIRVRQAVVHALNKKQIYDLVFQGQAIPAHGPMPPAYTSWALKEDPAGFDLAAAKKLMGEAGLADGFSKPFIWASASPSADQAVEVIKQQLSEINVNAELTPMETAAYYNLVYTYKYDMSYHNTTSTADPDEALSAYYGRTSTYYKYDGDANGIWDEIDAQSQELDPEARKELVDAVQLRIVKEYPVAFLYSVLLQQFTDPSVKNWFYSLDGYNVRVEDAWLDA
jgi:peptide/nickel transport system substrate-binding protein